MPTRAALVTVCVLVTLGAAFVLALYALTEPTSRPELLDRLATFGPAVLIAVPALLAWLRGEQVIRQNREQAETLETVRHQTNGGLTTRMREVVSEALQAHGLVSTEAPGTVLQNVDQGHELPDWRA